MPRKKRAVQPQRFTLRQLYNYLDLDCGAVAVGFLERDNTPDVAEGERERNTNRLSKAQGGGIAAFLPSRLLSEAVNTVAGSMELYHCELAFYLNEKGKQRFGERRMLALLVQENSTVQLRPREFHTAYRWYNVCCTPRQLRAMLAYAQSLQGQPFAYNAMARCVVDAGPDTRKVWFCSYLTASVLQYLPFAELHFNRPNTLSVDDLHEIIAQPHLRPVTGRGTHMAPAAGLDRAFERLDPRVVLLRKK